MKIPEKSESLSLKKAAQVLKKGGIVIFPTDTVYGIGCLYNNKEGLLKIAKIKNRPKNLPFPILVLNLNQAQMLVHMNTLAKNLARKYWPGGLTIISNSIDDKSKIGVRMPNSKIALSLIKTTGSPIVGTSANFHGKPSVSSSKFLDPHLVKIADYVIEGECKGGLESTVVDASGDEITIIRQGAITINNQQ